MFFSYAFWKVKHLSGCQSQELYLLICAIYTSLQSIFIYITNWFLWFIERSMRIVVLFSVVVCILRALNETKSVRVFNGCAWKYIERLSAVNFIHHFENIARHRSALTPSILKRSIVLWFDLAVIGVSDREMVLHANATIWSTNRFHSKM